MTSTQRETEQINIGLNDQQRQNVMIILNRVLADQYVLYTKLRNYHWNVVGPNFSELHKLFEEQYTILEGAIDETAERVRALGAPALGTLQEFMQHTRLQEHPGVYPDWQTMVANALDDHEAIIRQLRVDADAAGEQFNDIGTNDYLTALIQQHEKMAWMLRSYLQTRAG